MAMHFLLLELQTLAVVVAAALAMVERVVVLESLLFAT
jgi:hypothetical protein